MHCLFLGRRQNKSKTNPKLVRTIAPAHFHIRFRERSRWPERRNGRGGKSEGGGVRKPSRTVQISDKNPTMPEAKVERLKRRGNKITSSSEQKRLCE